MLFSKKCVVQAFKNSIPVFFGYIALGIAYGILVVEKNYPWWLSPLSGLVLYTGTGQFAAIGLFAAGASLPAILITEFLIGIRHLFYGLSLITKFSGLKAYKPYLIFALTDETYSILTTVDVPDGIEKGPFYFWISAFDQFYWIAGSTIGALIGTLIPFDFAGVDFALTALFAVLLVNQIKKTKDWVSVLCGGIATLLAIILCRVLNKNGILIDSSNILLVGMASGLAVMTAIKSHTLLKSEKSDLTKKESE